MSKNDKKNKQKTDEINFVAIIIRVIVIILTVAVFGGLFWVYMNAFKPEEKRLIKNSRFAYNEISRIVYDIYKKKGKVYDKPAEYSDSVCEALAEELSENHRGNCVKNPTGMPVVNFEIKDTKIAILGLEREGEVRNDDIIKEFIIDVDGVEKGADEIGKDRVPVQIHSAGRMAGKLMPVNCKLQDSVDFEIPRSKYCPTGFDTDFLTTNVPFGFDVYQVGSKHGKIEVITKNVPLVRADCAAFGGDILGGEYCEEKGIYWLKRCYEEYYCGISPSK